MLDFKITFTPDFYSLLKYWPQKIWNCHHMNIFEILERKWKHKFIKGLRTLFYFYLHKLT